MNIEEKVDSLIYPKQIRRKRGIGMRPRTLASIFIVLGVILSFTVSAVILDHFGEGAKAELDIDTSVVINELDWEASQAEPGKTFEGIAGCCNGTKDKIENRACVGGRLLFEDIVTADPMPDPGEVVAYHYIVPGWTTLTLENKDTTTWEILDDEIWAELIFNPCCPTFDFYLEIYAEPNVEYGLIYYADQQDRFANYGGDPLLEIATFTMNAEGYRSIHSNVELNQYFPTDDDWNVGLDADYSLPPDNYAHAKGGKLWIVPTSCYDEDSITDWDMVNFLFETDLVFYFDCDLEPPVWDADVLFDVLGAPLTSMYYDIGPKEEICLITYWCVDWASSGGLFNVKTYVSPMTPP